MKWTKWELLEVFYFNSGTYTVQVRQNQRTGFKQFKCRKMITFSYGNHKNITIDNINSLVKETTNGN